MIIGIDASRAFQKNRTGIEEYAYQVIKHLRDFLNKDQVILYCNPAINIRPDFELPKNWRIKNLRAPIFWTQARLSLEMIFHPVDTLFIPAHTVPLIHPKNTVVTIHGLEYEFCLEAYSPWQRFYMRFVIKNSCRWAKRVIAVSENTKKDLTKLYKVAAGKVEVIYEGIGNDNLQSITPGLQKMFNGSIFKSYLLFIGRLEERKNICGIIEAFEILKRKHKISHKLILVGKFGFGAEKIKNDIGSSEYKNDIILTGYLSEEDKYYLLRNADAFIFATFYEGFGLPILEAQSVGTPVITSDVSSMPEISGGSAALVDPKDANTIADAAYKLISDESYKNDIIEKGLVNVKRFSWDKCAGEVSRIIQGRISVT